jgi:hypothetical protein
MTQDQPPDEADRKAQRKRALARARKQRYDARMKGEISDNGEHLRQAVVLYLDDGARENLRRNRSQRKLLGLEPFIDSMLIEQLLTLHKKNLESEFNRMFEGGDVQTSRAKGERIVEIIRKQRQIISKLSKEKDSLISKVNQLDEEIENYENEKDSEKWFHMADKILLQHLLSKSILGYKLAQEILREMHGTVSDTKAFEIFSNSFEEHLLHLIDRIAGVNG